MLLHHPGRQSNGGPFLLNFVLAQKGERKKRPRLVQFDLLASARRGLCRASSLKGFIESCSGYSCRYSSKLPKSASTVSLPTPPGTGVIIISGEYASLLTFPSNLPFTRLQPQSTYTLSSLGQVIKL